MDQEPQRRKGEGSADPATRAREKADELALHAELAAVFEGPRKFDAEVLPGLDPGVARDAQRTVGRLEKARAENSPVLPPAVAADAAALLNLPDADDAKVALTRDDYHVYRRPGETMILRWLAGAGVEQFYERYEAHFAAALDAFRRDERSANEWKGDERVDAYLDALDKIDRKMADHYLRAPIRKHGAFVLSTLAVDEMDITFLCDGLMGVPAAAVVGPNSAPAADVVGDEPGEGERAWFFKLFCLRGVRDGAEQMCFFTYLQRSNDEFGF